ncbi:MAG: hypothetical protein E5V24_26530 [Mesorhizobium sp.]|nr:MAG: hypothetical protein E5V24_26530 [Mesorhizobium sp.]
MTDTRGSKEGAQMTELLDAAWAYHDIGAAADPPAADRRQRDVAQYRSRKGALERIGGEVL